MTEIVITRDYPHSPAKVWRAVTDPDLVPLEQVLAQADVLVVGAPHPQYQGLAVTQPFADVWGVLKSAHP